MTKSRPEKRAERGAIGAKTPGLNRWLLPALVFLLTFVVFFPTLQNGFVNWDDDRNLLDNPLYRGLGWAQLRWMFTTFHMGFYGPFTWVTFGLDYLFWGMNPAGYHLTSLLLHAMNGVLVYFLSLRFLSLTLGGPGETASFALRASAGVAAVLFAVHPLRVEAVAGASARNHVLSGLFLLWSVLCYLRYATASEADGSRPWRLTVSIIAYGLSLLSMTGLGMTLPMVLLVLDVYPLGRLGGGQGRWLGSAVRRVWWEKLPFVVLALGAAVVALLAKEQAGAVWSLTGYGFVPRLVQSVFGLLFYLFSTLLPLGLSPLYQAHNISNSWDLGFFLMTVVILLVSLCLYLLRRRWPAGLAVWICYVVILAPVLGLVQSGPQLVADRYSYLSCLGWAILVGGGLLYLWNRNHVFLSSLGTGITVLVIVGFGVLTWKQAQIWHDSERLWRHVLNITPDSDIAHNNLGAALKDQGRLEEATLHFNQALKANPKHVKAHYNLGLVLSDQGQLDEAIVYFRRAVEINPSYADAHNNLGAALADRGQLEEAMKHYRQTLEISPSYADAHYNLGVALADRGQLVEAIEHYRQALRIQPEIVEAHEGLGRALARQGKKEEAARHLQEAVRLLKSRREAGPAKGNIR